MNIQQKIDQAITNGSLSVKKEGEKNWYNYKQAITFLYWRRNLHDGYSIEVFDKKSDLHIETVII